MASMIPRQLSDALPLDFDQFNDRHEHGTTSSVLSHDWRLWMLPTSMMDEAGWADVECTSRFRSAISFRKSDVFDCSP